MDLEDFTLTRIHDQEKIIYRLRKLITDLEDDLKHVTALSKDEAAELITNQSRELADLRTVVASLRARLAECLGVL